MLVYVYACNVVKSFVFKWECGRIPFDKARHPFDVRLIQDSYAIFRQEIEDEALPAADIQDLARTGIFSESLYNVGY
jgi:hypothetical protein